MKCIEIKIGNMITRYQMGLVSSDEKKLYETHLLKCDACFCEFYEMDPVFEQLKVEPKFYLSAIEKKKESLIKRLLKRMSAFLELMIQPIPNPIRIAVPVAAVVILILFIVLPSPVDYSHLAQIEPVAYRPLVIRGHQEFSKAKQFFDEGMKYYMQEDYAEAIEKLTLSSESDPQNANTNFYLGICYFLQKEPDEAIIYLNEALKLGANNLTEKCHWYLGNAYLILNEKETALEQFNKVIEINGDLAQKARKMIDSIMIQNDA